MSQESSVSLKSLLVPSKSVEVEFPGMEGFLLDLSFLSREELMKIRKKATKLEYKNRVPTETLNDDLFLQLYVDGCIKGWKGLKFSFLETLAPVDISGQTPDDTLGYSRENALFLMKASSNFDSFISETVTELSNFQSPSGAKSVAK
jgi:hypothetical protein